MNRLTFLIVAIAVVVLQPPPAPALTSSDLAGIEASQVAANGIPSS